MTGGRGAAAGRLAVGATVGLVLAACSAAPTTPTPPPVQAPPPPPPAACLLDTGGLAAGTGLSWRPDPSTASDTRCVYDPNGAPTPAGEFLAVQIAPITATDAGGELDTVASTCADGSRAALAQGSGFVCRFRGGSVFAALVRAGQLITVSASGVPEGTTAARLVLSLQQQLDGLA
jgi:hypothetical protein